MVKSDNNFDEYDDDLDDYWGDDSLDDAPLPLIENDFEEPSTEEERSQETPHIKKISSTKYFLTFLLLGGVVAMTFFLAGSQQKEKKIPVIRIDKIINSGTKNRKTQTNSGHNIPNDTLGQTRPKKTKQKPKAILTPLPEDINENMDALALPDLITTEKNDINIGTVSSDKTVTVKKQIPKILNEEELLLKTDSIYEKPPIPNDTLQTPKITSVSIPTPLEQNSVQEILTEDITASPPPSPKKIIKTAIEKDGVLIKDTPPIPKNKIKRHAVWVIRAAQPGKAVIYDKNSKETKSIEINDMLNGIGRIKSIQLENGKWLILGTSGKIQQ